MAFIQLTRAIGARRNEPRWVNFDYVTDFSRKDNVTAVYFAQSQREGDGQGPEQFALFVQETPAQILEALAKHG